MHSNDRKPSARPTDRYVTFDGIACDEHARHLVRKIRDCIADAAYPSQWQTYFAAKLREAERRGHDDLYVVGSQINALRELFAQHGESDALALLERIEDECC